MDKYRYDPAIQAALEASPIPFIVYQYIDRRVVTLAVSAGFCDIVGVDDRDAIRNAMDNDMYHLTHPDDRARLADAGLRFAAGETDRYDMVYRTRLREDDDYIVLHAQGAHSVTETGAQICVVWYTREGVYSKSGQNGQNELLRAFSQMLREDSMVHENHYDPLTGLPNMTYFFALAEAGADDIRARGEEPAILFLDMCGMKSLNNKWGFSEGDKLIRAFGDELSQAFGGDSCSRFGQDHFTAFVPAAEVEERLTRLFAACESMNGGRKLPIRVGIYLLPAGVEIGKACDRAKMACDVNRKSRRSVWKYFDESMLTEAESRQYIIDSLDRALAEGWVQVYYQPIVRAANGRVCDEEALARWVDPVKGVLSPAEFIPFLEEARLIYKLDLYVLDRVIEKLRRQAEAGLYIVPQSINLSRVDFDVCDIVEEIRRRVAEAGISRSDLSIEITESVIGRNFDFMKKQVERFRKLGFRVWMDDFGSHYSSLDVLQNIRFDLIKFDMQFLRSSDGGPAGRVILSELIKMAISLGVETICEGVETDEQAAFLREVGCTKLQGYFYCRPIPLEEILRRYQTGRQIGFENPEESGYYAAVGRVNLYDMSAITSNDESLSRYFDNLPAAVMEINNGVCRYMRCNNAYRNFMKNAFGVVPGEGPVPYSTTPGKGGANFMSAVLRCCQDGNSALVDERLNGKTTVHSFIRRLAVNPVTGAAAVAVAVLAMTEEDGSGGTTYAHIAHALSTDYIYLYYIDLENDRFIEYSSDLGRENLAVERRGERFFDASRVEARVQVYPEDVEYVVESFTKENILRSIDERGIFALNFRQMIDGKPTYVNLKAVRMQGDDKHIVVGVTNVDAQVRQKQAINRMQSERVTFSRIAALAGDFISIYTVDPKTDHYVMYSANNAYKELKLSVEGDDFFGASRRDSEHALYSEDVERFTGLFTKENVMREIRRTGLFEVRYRLMIDGEPRYVNTKAALVEEQGEERLIIGVNNIDARVRREQEYERELHDARSRANPEGPAARGDKTDDGAR